ncbi:cache domain-containing protein, partial [sulfur-oxidizing endosymbiont of Gigantopelta aegis]|uniref:cache domain-containing protein n=1 Tax=sulfur-oxidizing endosymbiont of Gigantopelta aegis TaxID=2794934 RepID=UPI001FE86D1A
MLSETIALQMSAKKQEQSLEKDIRNLFKIYHDKNNSYAEIFLINKDTGDIWLSNQKNNEGLNKSDDLYFTQALNKKAPYIKNIYRSSITNEVAMSISFPVYHLEQKKKTLAILVMRINLRDSLFKYLNNNTALGKTGEIHIVNSHYLTLNQLKFKPDSALKLTVKSLPAVKAANGKTGVIEALDYRKEKVLAAYTYLPKTQWGFITKQDLKEIYSPLYQ